MKVFGNIPVFSSNQVTRPLAVPYQQKNMYNEKQILDILIKYSKQIISKFECIGIIPP